MYQRIVKILVRHMPIAQIAREAGVSRTTLYAWLEGREPRGQRQRDWLTEQSAAGLERLLERLDADPS